jgi:hypothetical protein
VSWSAVGELRQFILSALIRESREARLLPGAGLPLLEHRDREKVSRVSQ